MAIQTASALVLGCHVLKAHPLPQSIGLSILSEDSSLTGSLFSVCFDKCAHPLSVSWDSGVFMCYINEVCAHAFLYCSLYHTQTHGCAGVLMFFTCWPHNLIWVWGHSVNSAPAFILAPDLQLSRLPPLSAHPLWQGYPFSGSLHLSIPPCFYSLFQVFFSYLCIKIYSHWENLWAETSKR